MSASSYPEAMTPARRWIIWAISLAAYIATFIFQARADWLMPRLPLLLFNAVLIVPAVKALFWALEASKAARRREAEHGATAAE